MQPMKKPNAVVLRGDDQMGSLYGNPFRMDLTSPDGQYLHLLVLLIVPAPRKKLDLSSMTTKTSSKWDTQAEISSVKELLCKDREDSKQRKEVCLMELPTLCALLETSPFHDTLWLVGKKVICYNCRREGHVARQCKEQKRKMDSQYFKDKALLMEAKEKGDVLGVKPTSGASKTVPKRAPRNHSSLPAKSVNARRVEAHHRTMD
ncbi:retrovirus-related pol polyprotein from transposon TNT 1-94 [Tanacetum coccineum]